MNLQKKLKKMKISEDSIEIVWTGEVTQSELEKKFNELNNGIKKEEANEDITLYKFYNPITKHTITSIYPTLDNWKDIVDISTFQKLT